MQVPPRATAAEANLQEPRVGSILDLDPGRRMVAGLVAAAIGLVDAGIEQAVGGRRREQQMVDPEAGVALPATGGIIPEGIDRAVGIAGADRIGETKAEDAAERLAALGLHQRVRR